MRGIEGGIITKEMPLDISNVAILNPETNKADRVGIKLIEMKAKLNAFVSSNQMALSLEHKEITWLV